jgi:hypothetical protein
MMFSAWAFWGVVGCLLLVIALLTAEVAHYRRLLDDADRRLNKAWDHVHDLRRRARLRVG